MPRLLISLAGCLSLLIVTAAATAAPPAAVPKATTATAPTPGQTALAQAWQTRARIDFTRGRVSNLVLQGNTLFVQSDRSELEALDAETGRSLWSVIVGNRQFPTVPVAANTRHVAAVNGSTLYLLDRSTGGMQWTRELKGNPSTGPTMSSDRVYLPMLSGALEAYVLSSKTAVDRAPLIFFGHGAAESPPVVSDTRLMWGTNAGNVFIDALASSVNRVRFAAGGPIIGRLAYQSPRVFFTSLDGFVYAIEEAHGNKLWQYSLGGPTRQPPVVIGEAVYVVADAGGLWKLAVASGTQQWFAAGVKQFLAGSNARIYAADRIGNLVVLDANSGARLAVYDAINLPIKYLNRNTDRVYLANLTGYVTCFHEAGLSQPLSHLAPPAKKPEAAPKKKAAAAAAAEGATEQPAAKAEDPFAK